MPPPNLTFPPGPVEARLLMGPGARPAGRLARIRLDGRSLAAFGAPFLLYLLTLAPTVYNLDSAELTTAAATGGLMRATGYPLYLLLGSLWAHLPVGDVGYRMNLFSALCGALTLALAERILRRWRVGGWSAFGALGLLATAPYFWGLSLVAEVYTLHTALMAALILALLRWGERPAPGRLAAAGLLAGLGLGHHLSMALLLPGASLYLIAAAPRRLFAPRSLALGFLGLLAGLSVYLYLPWRYAAQPAFNYAGIYDTNLVFHPVNLQTPAGLWWLVSGQSFARQMLGYTGMDLWREAVHFGLLLGQAFFAAGVVPALIGLVWLWRRSRPQAILLALMFLGNTFFYIDYQVLDKATMFLPSYLIWSIWLALGYQAALGWLGRARPGLETGWEVRAAKALLVGMALLAAAWNFRLVDLSGDRSARLRGEAILAAVEPGALVLGWWDTVPVVQYLQMVEGQRPDVQAINRFLVSAADFNWIVRKEVLNRPVYIDSPPPDLLRELDVEPAGPVYRLVPTKR